MNNKKLSLFLLCLLCGLLVLAACTPIVAPSQTPTAEPMSEATTTDSVVATLSAEALMNATYSGIYDDPVTLSEGLYEEGDPPLFSVQYRANGTLFGDLDGDGIDDAIVFLLERGGGTAAFTYVAAQLNQNGQPVDAGSVIVEDRTQVRSATIQDGQLALEFTTGGPGDGNCCPSHMTRKTYALQDGRLTEIVGGDVELVRVSAADLDGTNWRLLELKENEPVADDVEITITFAGNQVSGRGGCNNYSGSFGLNDDNPLLVTFGPIAATRMACPDPADSQEAAYFSALTAASIWGYDFGNLVISYMDGDERQRLLLAPLAAADAEAPLSASLTGVTWRWVALTDPMQQVEIDAPERYTLTFLDDGSLQIQADCNQATAAYTASDDGALSVTPGITTLALCPPGSRSEELINKLGFAARYFFQDGHLFIDMMADGGTLEFRP